jgi:hypothetical protein
MIVECANCRANLDCSGAVLESAVRCICGEILVMTEKAQEDGVLLIRKYLDRLATEEELPPVELGSGAGWELRRGSARVKVEVLENGTLLSVHSEIMPVPGSPEAQNRLFLRLLEMNSSDTGVARFGITEGKIQVIFSRSITGLDYFEFHSGVEAVCRVSDDYDDTLRQEFLEVQSPAEGDEDEIDLSKIL